MFTHGQVTLNEPLVDMVVQNEVDKHVTVDDLVEYFSLEEASAYTTTQDESGSNDHLEEKETEVVDPLYFLADRIVTDDDVQNLLTTEDQVEGMKKSNNDSILGPCEGNEHGASLNCATVPRQPLSSNTRVPTVSEGIFPKKLHFIVEYLSYRSPDLVAWNYHGRSFIVRDMGRFITVIAPQCFKFTSGKSFNAQLRRYPSFTAFNKLLTYFNAFSGMDFKK